MTNELEKTFFDTFGIEPRLDCKRCGAMNFALGQCAEVDCKKTYPTITDRILLNLILIMNPYAPPVGDTMEEMKEQVLYWCIRYATEIKHQVRTLFEEG